jgi:F-type H+-transporting ATPase subunit epsilon
MQIITPKKLVKELDIDSITLPSADGEITILPSHAPLLALLDEGIVTYRIKGHEEMLAIGGGYVQTDGSTLRLLVSRAYGEDEIDEQVIARAKSDAERILSEAKDESSRAAALSQLRRSAIDSKLLRKKKGRNIT